MRRHGFDRISLAVVVAALLIAAAINPLAGAGAADAASVRGNVLPAVATAPAYQLEGFTWPVRTSVAVYYTWDGGPCLIDGTDLSGPAGVVSPAVALQALQSSLEDINSRLRGGLLLVNAGPASRADLCSSSKTRPIVVGFGNIGPTGTSTETGLALSFGLTSSSTPGIWTYQAARVFLSNSYTFACTGTAPYRDLQHTVTHELLHAIGIGHSQDQAAIMAPSSVACQSPYVLQPDDVAGLAALYPPAAPTGGVGTGPGTFATAPIFGTGTQALVVFNGGSVDQLESAALAVGATGVWVQDATGAYELLIVDGPAFLKNVLKTRFPSGFVGVTATTLIR